MAILGLTDKPASIPELGHLRKGAPKPGQGNKPGADLKHFRFETDDEKAAGIFKSIYGDEPRSIRFYVPFPSVDDNFDAWQEEWAKSSLKHRCDGQTCVLWLTPKGTYSRDPKPCPGGCKASGRLKIIVPDLKRLAFVTVHTTSKWDVMNIHANLLALENARGSLMGIPLLLKRVPKEISTPTEDGGRARREKWLIAIEAQPDWVALQLTAQQQAALPIAPTPLSLSPYLGEEDDDDDAVYMPVSPAPSTKPVTNGKATHAEPVAVASEAEKTINELLLNYCVAQKGNEKAGKAFFDAMYAKRSLEQKQTAVLDLKLETPEEVHQGEVVESGTI